MRSLLAMVRLSQARVKNYFYLGKAEIFTWSFVNWYLLKFIIGWRQSKKRRSWIEKTNKAKNWYNQSNLWFDKDTLQLQLRGKN
mgnify:CR=1 FL=1